MTTYRRVVTGHDKNGSAVVASDDQVPLVGMHGMEGWGWLDLWANEKMHFPDEGKREDVSWMFPPRGSMRYGHAVIPPHTEASYKGADKAPEGAVGSDMNDTISDDGSHRLATLDVITILRGSCVCELDNGVKVQLNEGDTLIQNGTNHSWSNPFDAPCQMTSVMIGATHDMVKEKAQ